MLTNVGVWSPDSQWIVYDVRSDPAGSTFDGTTIERVHVESGQIEVLYESRSEAHCGVATYCGNAEKVVFIHGPDKPDPDWQYAAYHRRGVVVQTSRPGRAINLDARNLVPPFTPGALRGGTHVHTFSGDGLWVAFTYEDHILATAETDASAEPNQRNVGICVPVDPRTPESNFANQGITVPRSHRRNHDGSHFAVLVTETIPNPRPGSGQISKAFSDGWIGRNGYLRSNGRRQEKAIAFQGHVLTESGNSIAEVFVVDIPNDVSRPGPAGPLEGTQVRRPRPPLGTVQRRLTYSADRKYPGIQGVRHWLRSSPDGSQIAFLMRDDDGVVQLWTISPLGGAPDQVTNNQHDISSAFSWTPDGQYIAHTMDESVCITQVASGTTQRLTKPNLEHPLRPEACVVSPTGRQIAYLRQVPTQGGTWNQIFVCPIPN